MSSLVNEHAKTGVMIALKVPSPEQYALRPEEFPGVDVTPADELHITLAYLGKVDELPEGAVEALEDACRALAEQETAPNALFPAGSGVFPPDPDQTVDEVATAPLWLMPQPTDPFLALRERLMVHLEARGVADLVSTKHKVFNPHVTLAYMPLEQVNAPLDLPMPLSIDFAELVLVVGPEWLSFPLASEADAASQPLPLTAEVEDELQYLARTNPGFSADLLRAKFLEQRPAPSPVATRSYLAMDAVKQYVAEYSMAAGLSASASVTATPDRAPRLSELINRASIEPNAVRRAFNLNRALALAARLPGRDGAVRRAQLAALVADGNSSAARSMRARMQLRDRHGRWIKMGRGVRFKTRKPGFAPTWSHGTVEGIDVPNGQVHVRLENGKLVSVPNDKLEQPKAVLGLIPMPKSAGKKAPKAPIYRPWSPSRPAVTGPGASALVGDEPSWGNLRDNLKNKSVISFDTETTGFDLEDGTDGVIELAATRRRPDGSIDKFSTMVNPGKPIDPAASAVHGITDADIADAPSPAEALASFKEWAAQSEDNVFSAHNANFDMSALQGMDPDAAPELAELTVLDTFALARAGVPKKDAGGPADSHSLGSLADAFGVDAGTAHRAGDDADAALNVLDNILDYAVDHDRSADALTDLGAKEQEFKDKWPAYLEDLQAFKASQQDEPAAYSDPNAPDPDADAVLAMERILETAQETFPNATISGGNLNQLISDVNLKAAIEADPDAESWTFEAAKNPFKGTPLTLQASDVNDVRNSLTRLSEEYLPDGFDGMDEAEQLAASKKAVGKAYSTMAAKFNDRNSDPELKSAPTVAEKDVKEIEEAFVKVAEGAAKPSDTEVFDTLNDVNNELKKRVSSKDPYAEHRDALVSGVEEVIAARKTGELGDAGVQTALKNLFTYADKISAKKPPKTDKDRENVAAIEAFAEDLDDVLNAIGADTEDVLDVPDPAAVDGDAGAAFKARKAMGALLYNTINGHSRPGFLTELLDSNSASEMREKLEADSAYSALPDTHPNKKDVESKLDEWEKIGPVPEGYQDPAGISAELRSRADAIIADESHPDRSKVEIGLASTQTGGYSVSDLKNIVEKAEAAKAPEVEVEPEVDETEAETALPPHLDPKLSGRFAGWVNQNNVPWNVREDAETAYYDAINAGSTVDEALDAAAAEAGIPSGASKADIEAEVDEAEIPELSEIEESVSDEMASAEAALEALLPEEAPDAGTSPSAETLEQIEKYNETLDLFDSVALEPEALNEYADNLENVVDDVFEAMNKDQFYEDMGSDVAEFTEANEALVQAVRQGASAPAPAPEAELPSESATPSEYLEVYSDLDDIAKGPLAEPLGAIGNAVASVGKQIEEGKLSPADGAKLLDGLVSEIDELYVDPKFEDLLDGTDAGDSLDEIRDSILALSKKVKAQGPESSSEDLDAPEDPVFEAVVAVRDALAGLEDASPAPKNQPGKKALAEFNEMLDDIDAGNAPGADEASQKLDTLVKALAADSWGKKGKTYTAAEVSAVETAGKDLVAALGAGNSTVPAPDAPDTPELPQGDQGDQDVEVPEYELTGNQDVDSFIGRANELLSEAYANGEPQGAAADSIDKLDEIVGLVQAYAENPNGDHSDLVTEAEDFVENNKDVNLGGIRQALDSFMTENDLWPTLTVSDDPETTDGPAPEETSTALVDALADALETELGELLENGNSMAIAAEAQHQHLLASMDELDANPTAENRDLVLLHEESLRDTWEVLDSEDLAEMPSALDAALEQYLDSYGLSSNHPSKNQDGSSPWDAYLTQTANELAESDDPFGQAVGEALLGPDVTVDDAAAVKELTDWLVDSDGLDQSQKAVLSDVADKLTPLAPSESDADNPEYLVAQYELAFDAFLQAVADKIMSTPEGLAAVQANTGSDDVELWHWIANNSDVQKDSVDDVAARYLEVAGVEDAEDSDTAVDAVETTPSTPVDGPEPTPAPAPSAAAPREAGQLGTLGDMSSPVHNVDLLEKIGGNLGGGSVGGTFRDDEGNVYYVKKPDTPSHAHNEVLTSMIYRDMGINASVVELGTQNGQTVIVSKWVPGNEGSDGSGAGLIADKVKAGDDEFLKAAQDGYVLDAWMANWDVVGPKQNNIVVGKDENGNEIPFRIDGGGSMLYSGFGTPKGSKFGKTVSELESLRDPSMNMARYEVFKGVDGEFIKKDAERLASLSPSRLRELIDATGHDQGTKDKLFDVLSARQADILSKTGVAKPADAAAPQVERAVKEAGAKTDAVVAEAPNMAAAEAIITAENGTEPSKLWVGADGVQLKIGDKVVSTKDGKEGVVVSLSANGKYAKVWDGSYDDKGKKKFVFRFPHTLQQSAGEQQEAPAAPAAPATPVAPSAKAATGSPLLDELLDGTDSSLYDQLTTGKGYFGGKSLQDFMADSVQKHGFGGTAQTLQGISGMAESLATPDSPDQENLQQVSTMTMELANKIFAALDAEEAGALPEIDDSPVEIFDNPEPKDLEIPVETPASAPIAAGVPDTDGLAFSQVTANNMIPGMVNKKDQVLVSKTPITLENGKPGWEAVLRDEQGNETKLQWKKYSGAGAWATPAAVSPNAPVPAAAEAEAPESVQSFQHAGHTYKVGETYAVQTGWDYDGGKPIYTQNILEHGDEGFFVTDENGKKHVVQDSGGFAPSLIIYPTDSPALKNDAPEFDPAPAGDAPSAQPAAGPAPLSLGDGYATLPDGAKPLMKKPGSKVLFLIQHSDGSLNIYGPGGEVSTAYQQNLSSYTSKPHWTSMDSSAVEAAMNTPQANASTPDSPGEHPAQSGAQKNGPSLVGMGGEPLYKGTQVKHATSGVTGYVVGFSTDGKSVRVLAKVNGKYVQRQWVASKVGLDPEAKAKKTSLETPKGMPIPRPDAGQITAPNPGDPNSPWYLKPAPVSPETPFDGKITLPDEWMDMVEADYLAKKGEALPADKITPFAELPPSTLHKYTSAKNGSLHALETLKANQNISDETYEFGKKYLEEGIAAQAKALAEHDAKVQQWVKDRKEWAAAQPGTALTLKGLDAFDAAVRSPSESKTFAKTELVPTGLTSAQRSAVATQKSTSSWQSELRKQLKEKSLNKSNMSPYLRSVVDGLDGAISAAPPVPEDMVVTRTFSVSSFVDPETSATMHFDHGQSKNKGLNAIKARSLEGTVQTDWGYAESSIGSLAGGAAPGYTFDDVWVDVLVPAGTRGISTIGDMSGKNTIGGHVGERGFILERGTAYYIHSVEWRTDLPGSNGKGRWYAKAEIIPKGADPAEYNGIDYYKDLFGTAIVPAVQAKDPNYTGPAASTNVPSAPTNVPDGPSNVPDGPSTSSPGVVPPLPPSPFDGYEYDAVPPQV